MKNRNRQRQEEEQSAKPHGEFCKDRGGLGTKEIVGESSTKGGTESLALGTLHENG